jgi:uncharacterized membrane protein YdjX (TVP38/TMEM64 family)
MTLARLKHLLPLALLIAGLICLLAFGLGHDLSWASLSHHQDELLATVAARPVEAATAYVVIYAVLVACSVPEAAIATVTGGLLFGTAAGGALAVIGASIGAVALFLAARYAFADLLAAHAAPFMTRIRPGIERDGFLYLLAIRLVPVFPFWLVNLAAAACGIRLLPFTAATLLGIIPGTLVFAAIGAGLSDVLAHGNAPSFATVFSPHVLLPMLGLAALTLLPVAWRSLRARSARKASAGSAHAHGADARVVGAHGTGAQGAKARRTDAEGTDPKGA